MRFFQFIAFVFLFFLQSTLVWSDPIKEKIDQFAQATVTKINQDQNLTATKRLYQLSMPLLAFAAVGDLDKYKSTRDVMNSIILNDQQAKQIELSWKLWLIGRMAVAAKLIKDQKQLEENKSVLAKELPKQEEMDVFTGWAFAYFASLDEESYKNSRDKLLDYASVEKDKFKQDPLEGSNCVWLLVMNIYAAASNHNQDDYDTFLTLLKDLTEEDTLASSIALVPVDDYRQWLISILRYSFALMKDGEHLDELKAIHHREIDSLDVMLSEMNEVLIGS